MLFIVLGAYWGIKLYQPTPAGPSGPSDATAEATPAVSDEQEERAEPQTESVQPAKDSEQAGATQPDPAAASASSSGPRAGAMTVEILATDKVWLRSIADGTATREVTLYEGERHRVVADEVVHVLFGNAGGATVLIDGVRQDKVGEFGQVRQIRITPEGWSQVP